MTEKAQIMATLREEFDRWEILLVGIREEQITTPHLVGEWSIKDIVAHLTAWQERSVARLEAARHNREPMYPKWPPELDAESEKDLDQINAWIYKIHQEEPWTDVHREWKERYLHFLELGEVIPERDLFDAARYPWLDGYQLSAVLTGSYEHHKEHREPVVILLRKNKVL